MKKTAIVTGGTGGIGYGTVKELLSRDYNVVCVDLRDDPELPEGVLYVKGSVAEAADRQKVLDEAIKAFGKVHVLVNVAGVAPRVRRDILEMTEESYDFVMDINTKGLLFLTQLLANHMIAHGEPGCAIVNISSMSAYTSSTSRGEYCISKAGLHMTTSLFADRLAGDRINVYELRPGIIETDMTAVVKDKYDALIAGGLLPIKRMGKPADIGQAVLGLTSGLFAYSTGDVINLDGGFHISRL